MKGKDENNAASNKWILASPHIHKLRVDRKEFLWKYIYKKKKNRQSGED